MIRRDDGPDGGGCVDSAQNRFPAGIDAGTAEIAIDESSDGIGKPGAQGDGQVRMQRGDDPVEQHLFIARSGGAAFHPCRIDDFIPENMRAVDPEIPQAGLLDVFHQGVGPGKQRGLEAQSSGIVENDHFSPVIQGERIINNNV